MPDLSIAVPSESERIRELDPIGVEDLFVVVAPEPRRVREVLLGASEGVNAAFISAGLAESFRLGDTATVITGGQAILPIGDVTTQFRKWIDANAAGVDANTNIRTGLQAALLSTNTDLTTLVREFIAR